MATPSSVLAWRIPWVEEPGGLPSMGLQRAGCDWATEQRPSYWSTLCVCVLAMLDLHCCAGFSLVAVSGDCSLVAVWGHLIAVASLVAEHGLKVAWAQELWRTGSIVVAHRLNCSSACGIFWISDKPVSPAMAGGFFMTETPGKPLAHSWRMISLGK